MSEQQSAPIRILIVDDHAVMRAGLRAMLENQPHMHVVGEAADRATTIAIAAAEQPDIILLDLDLGDDNGFDLLPELLNIAPEAHVIVLTGLRDPEAHRRAVLLGAMGLVLKEKAFDTVLKAIEKVHAGEVWLDRAMIASILNIRAHGASTREENSVTAQIATLTDREREVIQLIGQGLRNKAIAERLVISEATVRNHLTSIFSKLEVNDRFELVVYAYRHHLAEPLK
jgi:DNA-binding NarL/FixJ family response regulator